MNESEIKEEIVKMNKLLEEIRDYLRIINNQIPPLSWLYDK